MASISLNNPQGLEATATVPSPRPNAVARPGWPEIIVGFVLLGAVTIGGAVLAGQLGLAPVVFGLILTALAGVTGIAGFAAAVLLRIRSWSAPGVRHTTVERDTPLFLELSFASQNACESFGARQ